MPTALIICSDTSHRLAAKSLLRVPFSPPHGRAGIVNRNARLRKTNDRVVPAEIVRDPYPRNQPQTHEDGRGTKDSPINANKHRAQVPVARRGYYFCLVHWSGSSGELTNTATCESGRRTIIAWGFVSDCRTGVDNVMVAASR